MDSALDTAIKTALTAEATYNADVATVANIQTAISAAEQPLAAAQSTGWTPTRRHSTPRLMR